MKKSLVSLFFLSICFYTYSQNIIWDGKNESMEIGNKLQTLEDARGALTIEEVRSARISDKFIQSEKVNLNFGYTESIFWLKFSLDNITEEPLLLEVAEAGLPVTDLFYLNDSGNMVKMEAGYHIPLNEKIFKDPFQVFPLPQGKHDFYVRLSSNSEPIPVRIYKAPVYETKANNLKLVYGFYLGFMCFVMLINLFFFFSLRNRMYLFYALIVVLYISYAASVVDGFMVYFFPHVDLIFWYTTIPTIGVTIQTIYCLLFLEVRKYDPKLYKTTLGIVIYFAVWAMLKFLFRFPVVQPINTLNALISFFMMGFIGVKVGKKGNKLGYYFALAYFIYFLLVLTQATYINTGTPPYLLGLSHVAYATLIEAFLLSFLLSKRFEWEKEEIEHARTFAQEQVIEKTLENERIVREQNVVLEQRVNERTSQLKEANEGLNTALQIVETEKQKSESLLLNILPAATVLELKEKGYAVPQNHESVTVLFSDIKDFTKYTASMHPEKLVNDLNHCFKEFDRIIKKYGIEKIKTIGDAYMAAGGLHATGGNNAENVVKAALEMISFMKELKQQNKEITAWEVRIGISTGPVVSGVVGMHKFAYDIWGDTVNTSARMESNGEAGRVNISASTYELIKEHFTCKSRGKVNVKGKGELEMFWVEEEKVHLN